MSDAQDIRNWAKAQGITVGDRGRLPSDLIEQWEAAQGNGATAPPKVTDEEGAVGPR